MQKRSIQRGRPVGATTFEAEPAHAFGAAVRALRTEQGVAQETLAHLAGIERSHMGKIERGEHMPTLAIILKVARALGCSAADLMTATESRLAAAKSLHWPSDNTPPRWAGHRGRRSDALATRPDQVVRAVLAFDQASVDRGRERRVVQAA